MLLEDGMYDVESVGKFDKVRLVVDRGITSVYILNGTVWTKLKTDVSRVIESRYSPHDVYTINSSFSRGIE